jgi:hypothetical protein
MGGGCTEVGSPDDSSGLINSYCFDRLIHNAPNPIGIYSTVSGTGQKVRIMMVTQYVAANIKIVLDLCVHRFGYRDQAVLFKFGLFDIKASFRGTILMP